MAKEKKYEIKRNKNHNGIETKSFFRLIGRVSPLQRQDETTKGWEDVPFYSQKPTRNSGKPRRVLNFQIETAKGNKLRVESAGMEFDYAYAYSSRHKKTIKIDWENRLDREKWKDENKKVKTKDIDDTYHLMSNDWDLTEELSKKVSNGDWVEVKGYLEPNEFEDDEGKQVNNIKRIITSINPIVEGKLKYDNSDELKPIKVNGKEITYITDFDDENFIEVNQFSMQIGIRSTYQDEETRDTKVNGTYFTYGKDRSEPRDVELMVPYIEPEKGKALADAFASLEFGDFIEVTGIDNNRVTFTYVDIEESIDDSDPFSEVDDSQRTTRKQRVTNGEKKGLEVTGYVAGSIHRGLLTEDDFRKTVEITHEKPFEETDEDSDNDPFNDTDGDIDPFQDD